jgi:hypothetical protein
MYMQCVSRHGSTGARACRNDVGTIIIFIQNNG